MQGFDMQDLGQYSKLAQNMMLTKAEFSLQTQANFSISQAESEPLNTRKRIKRNQFSSAGPELSVIISL